MIEKQHTTEELIKTALDELDQYQVRRYAQHLYNVRNALYKALQAPCEWVALTGDEIAELVCNLEDPENRIELGQKIEERLKEKNNPTKEKDIK